MRSEELFEIIDGIDDDIILDVPEADVQRPIKIVVEKGGRTSFWKLALAAACLVCVMTVGIFAAVKLHGISSTESGSGDPVISDNRSDDSSSSSSDPETSEPEQDDYILDEAILNEMRLNKDDLPDLVLLGDTEGLEYKTLFKVTNGEPVNKLWLTETGPAIWFSKYPNYHYFWIDSDGNELDHVGFNFYDQRDRIPDINYPGSDVFVSDGEVLYYSGGKLQKTVQLPQSHRASFSADHLQYLYIDPKRNKLTLYDLETGSAVKELSVKDLGFSEPWVLDFVNVVTPKLATVTLLEFDENMASEYQGNENFRTFLLELPTLNIIQQLPDGAELTALNDETFLMTKQEDTVRRVSRAWLENGRLVEAETEFIINEKSLYFAPANIILSPEKRVALLLDWAQGGSYMRCRAVSTDTMQVLWEAHISGENGTVSLGYPCSAITDDAVMYFFGALWYSDDKYLYRIGAQK